MERMETDIEQRHQDRLKRDKNCDLFRNQAKTAFKNNEYENALVLYHKVNLFQHFYIFKMYVYF